MGGDRLRDGGPLIIHVLTVQQSIPFIDPLVKSLRERGFETCVITSPGPILDAFGRRSGSRIAPVSMAREISPLADLAAIFRLTRLFRHRQPLLVHSHTPKAGLLGMLAARLAGVPVCVYHMRGLLTVTATGVRRHLFRLAEKTSCRLADVVICQSASLRQHAINDGLVRSNKARVLLQGSNGVDATERFDPAGVDGAAVRRQLKIPEDAYCVGFVGRMVRDKGIIELTDAWRSLRRSNPVLHLLLVGPLEARNRIPDIVFSALEEDSRVHLVGEIADITPYYAALDLVVLPSHREGFPNVPLEAAAMALPVVTTNAVGCADAALDDKTGTVIDVGDAEALAQAIAAYAADPEMGRRHGRAGRQRVLRDFRPERIRAAMIELYKELGVDRDTYFLQAPGRLWARAIKRALDIAASAAGLVILAPILALLAGTIRILMGAPVLFRHTRPGLRERPFVLYKFRTMRPPETSDNAPWFRTDELRLTQLGRFLRATSLDELPQLWNVLRGDMSLVGPRPLLMEYLPKYSRRQRKRHAVRPGITGLAAIRGRHSMLFSQRLRLDVEYVERWNLRLDLGILARTAASILRRSGVRTSPDIDAVDDLGFTPEDDQAGQAPQ